MKISTKGRYALRIMIDIGEREKEGIVSVADIAARQDISLKYAEAIVSALLRAGLVVSRRGKSGGYNLSKSADTITAGEILRAGEGSLNVVACLAGAENECPRSSKCKTLPFWRALDDKIAAFCDSVTLQELINGTRFNQIDEE